MLPGISSYRGSRKKVVSFAFPLNFTSKWLAYKRVFPPAHDNVCVWGGGGGGVYEQLPM